MGPAFAILGAAGVTALGQAAKGKVPSPTIIVGGAVAGAAMAALAGPSPELAGKFATLVLLTALLTSGADVALAVFHLLGVNPSQGTDKPATGRAI